MIDIKALTEEDAGRRVKYTGGAGETEFGMIKSWNEHSIFVVYKCNHEWERFQDFTGQSTRPEDLEFEDWCLDCEGTGEVSRMEAVYPGEPHMADIGTQKCHCQINEPDHEQE